MDVAYNKGNSTTIVVDNRITGMTGHQEHPGTGFTIRQEPTNSVDYAELGRVLGIKSIRKIDPYNIKETMQIVKEELDRDESSLIVCKNSPCIMLRREKRKFEHPYYQID